MSNINSQLIEKIEKDTNYILNDVKTFIYVRSELKDKYDTQAYGIGGGNFLMLVGLFSVLFYLAKCNAVLRDNKSLLSGTSLIYRILHLREQVWSLQRIVDRKALRELLKQHSDLELSKKQFNQLMDSYRNHLAHLGLPRLPINTLSYSKNKSFKAAIKSLNNWAKSFDIDTLNSITLVNSDLLYRDVLNIRKSLFKEVKQGRFEVSQMQLLLNLLN